MREVGKWGEVRPEISRSGQYPDVHYGLWRFALFFVDLSGKKDKYKACFCRFLVR